MHGGFVDILLLMTVAVVLVWLFKRIQLPPILAYLCCGMLAGSDLLVLLNNPDEMHFLAELGIVFLLFSLGLEFSLPKMVSMRYWVFGIGLSQMLTTTLVFSWLAWLLGLAPIPAFVVGSMVALSSTAIVIKQTTELGILNTLRAQMAVSVLLLQDLAVVPLLIVIPLLAGGSEQSLLFAILTAVLKGAVVFVTLLAIGKWILPKVFNEIARTRTDELFVLTTILVALFAAGLTYVFGLSMTLGAFLAGMMLGESQYRHQLEADIRPFRDILMGLFFITIGMRLDLSGLVFNFHWIVLGLIVVLVLKALLVYLAARIFRAPSREALASGIKLSQMGEFSFVIAALALQHNLISNELSSLLISVGILSMACTPWLVNNSEKLATQLLHDKRQDHSHLSSVEQQYIEHILILGYGRVGQSVKRLLKEENIDTVVVDIDPVRVNESRIAGDDIYFGDVRNKNILRAVNIEQAKLVLITFDQHHAVMNAIENIRSINSRLPIVVRTRKDHHLEELYAAGATQVVPEILEGNLMLVSQVLHLNGVPMAKILKRVGLERQVHYQHMHNFFPGKTLEEYSTRMQVLHAVPLLADAFGIGKTLDDLNLASMRVSVTGLRRDRSEMTSPTGNTRLQENDVLLIFGAPWRLERAERIILKGH